MQAKEFIIEVSLENLAKTPVKGGQTLGQVIAQKVSNETAQEQDELSALELLSAADPTQNNSMVKWLARIYLSPASNFKIPEDINQVNADLTKFLKLSKQKKLQPGHTDLNKFKTLEQLYDALEQYSEEEVQSGKEKQAQAKLEGAEYIINEPGLKVIHTKTHEANCMIGAGTKWCTASKGDDTYFNQYSDDGPLYAIIAGEGANQKKYQFHYESDQFLDARDSEVTKDDIDLLSDRPGWAKFLNMQIEQHYGKYFNEAA